MICLDLGINGMESGERRWRLWGFHLSSPFLFLSWFLLLLSFIASWLCFDRMNGRQGEKKESQVEIVFINSPVIRHITHSGTYIPRHNEILRANSTVRCCWMVNFNIWIVIIFCLCVLGWEERKREQLPPHKHTVLTRHLHSPVTH